MKFKAFLCLLVLLTVVPFQIAGGDQKARYLYTSTLVIENRGDTTLHLSEEDASIPLFKNDNWQTVKIQKVSVPIAREFIDVDGNWLAILDMTTVPPHSKLNFSITYEIESWDRARPSMDPSRAGKPSDLPPKIVEEFTGESESFTTEDEMIKALAHRLTDNETTVMGKVARILDWIARNISYDNFEVARYPNETLTGGQGDCDDQAILLITMCRTLGIPAFLQIGVIFDDGIQGEKTSWGGHLHVEQGGIGWHGWAMVHIPPWGWLPIDMTLTTATELLTRIRDAPEYQSQIVLCLNVSRQDYVGDARRSREQLISSDLYVTSSEKGTRLTSSPSSFPSLYAIVGISIGAIITIAIILIIKRR